MKNLKSSTTIVILLLNLAWLGLLSCGKSETLIIGQMPKADEYEGYSLNDFKGKTVYFYPESEIKTYLEGRNSAVQEVISQENALKKKCEELGKNIPNIEGRNLVASGTSEYLAALDQYNKAKRAASECSDKYNSIQDNINQVYFENIPDSALKTTITDDGSFAIKVPSNHKYVFIVPKYSITWINAIGERKFLMVSARIDTKSEIVW